MNVNRRKFYDWKKAYGQGWKVQNNLPKSHFLEQWERDKIVEFYREHQHDGYRRCTYMMIDQDIVYTTPSTVYSVLKKAGAMRTKYGSPSKKGSGFNQPNSPHSQWHSDITNVTIGVDCYYLISILDGYSRAVIAWDLRKEMKTPDIGIVFQKAKELYPNVYPRCITDNGKQYKCKEFTKFIKDNQYSHTTITPYYPQSNGKQERMQGSIKFECLRIKSPTSYLDAKVILEKYIKYYNTKRLHSAIGYIAPFDKMAGKEKEIWRNRDNKIEQRRLDRQSVNYVS